MMADKKRPTGNYEVGYCRPPKDTQFRKEHSGNPRGAPPKQQQELADVASVLNEPIFVNRAGTRRKMGSFEVSVRKLVGRALKEKDLNAIQEFIRLCETLGIMEPPPVTYGGGVMQAPPGVDFHEWLEATFINYQRPEGK